MRRREFAIWLGSVGLVRPLCAVAQRPPIPVIGYVRVGPPLGRDDAIEAFRRGLNEGGYIDGKDATIEFHQAEGGYGQVPAILSELVRRKVAVIVAGGTPVALAAKSATSSIPIVFSGGGDPVKLGLVVSLGRPGGNVTGIANIGSALEGKRIQILHDLLPAAKKIAYLANPQFPAANALMKDAQSAAAASALAIQVLNAQTEGEIDSAFAAIAKSRVDAILVSPDSFFIARRNQIVALAARYSIPACYAVRDFAAVGGLISYGADLRDSNRQLGLYTARILKGAKPADLPVIQSVKITLVVNRKTVMQLGLAISRDFLERVDEVIE